LTDIVNRLSITQGHTRNLIGKRCILAVLNHTILVVEDNILNMKLFHDLLEMGGYNVLQAKDGMEGWRMAREQRPNLILMDIQLPDVDGLQVTKWLKADENLKSIPVIAVTAYAMSGDEEKILESGCDAYITKPISLPDFLDTIERFDKPLVAEREAVQSPMTVQG
jgi:two-component system cell cycle response regulator DivK